MFINHHLHRPSNGRFRLGIAAVVIAVLWLIVLPWIAERPRMAAHLQWLDTHKIDPSAMFYTELESFDPVLERLERR